MSASRYNGSTRVVTRMDSVLELKSSSVRREEAREEEARVRLEAMTLAGNKNAKEAIERFTGWQKRRVNLGGLGAAVRPPNYTDILMRIQVRELSDLARMGIEPAIRSLEEIRVAKASRHHEVKKVVDEIHHRILGVFRDRLQEVS